MPWDLVGALGFAVIAGGRMAKDMNCLCQSRSLPCYIISSKCIKEFNNTKGMVETANGDENYHRHTNNNHDTYGAANDPPNANNNLLIRQTLSQISSLSPILLKRNPSLVSTSSSSVVTSASKFRKGRITTPQHQNMAILSRAVIVDYHGRLKQWKHLVCGYHDISPTGDAQIGCQYIQSTLEWAQQIPDALFIFVPDLSTDVFSNDDVDNDDDCYSNRKEISGDDHDEIQSYSSITGNRRRKKNENECSNNSNNGFLLTIQQRFRTETNGGDPLENLQDLSIKSLLA